MRLDPARVDHAGAHDAGRLLGERAHLGRAGSAESPNHAFGSRAGERADGGDHAAVVLQVVVGVEDVVLAVVLVLDGHVDGGEAAAHGVLVGDAVAVAAVGEAGPGDVDRGEVVVGAPVALLEQRQDAHAVGARRRAVDARVVGRRAAARSSARAARRATPTSATASSTRCDEVGERVAEEAARCAA